MRSTGHDLDEPPEQGSHQIWRQRVGRRARRRERRTSASSDSPSGWPCACSTSWSWRAGSTPQARRYCRLSSGLRLRRDTTRSSSRQAGSARQRRTRCCPSGDHRQGGGRQPRQQSGAYPVIQRRQPLIGVEQNHHPAIVGRPGDGTLSVGHLNHLPQRLEARPAETGRDRDRQVEPRLHQRRPRARHKRPTNSSCRCLVARGREAHERAVRASPARPGTAPPQMRGRRIVAADETPTGRRACRETASQS